MNCIDTGKIEAWMTGEDPKALTLASLAHVRECPACRRKLQWALALKASAGVPASDWLDAGVSNCSSRIGQETLLSYLDDRMGAPERTAFETHLSHCSSCKQSLLQYEFEMADMETAMAEVPGFLLSKARAIGETEILRQESKNWLSTLDRVLGGLTPAWLQPRWAGSIALMAVVAVGSILYLRTHQPTVPVQESGVNSPPAVSAIPQNQNEVSSALVDPAIQRRVENVLRHLAQANGNQRAEGIRIQIVNSKDYIAQISPNGLLTVSTQYIAATQNDDELAFLLAHEMAHRQHPAQCILSFTTSSQQPPEVLNSARQKQEELEADRMGLFLAAVAGYHANAAENLFSRIQVLPGISDASHPAFSARLKETDEELRSIVHSIDLFHVGVSFFNTEQYSRSVAVFKAVAQEFPSRETFNDLGLAYHKLALEYSSQNWGFKKSVILDPVARAIEPVREDLPEANLFSKFLANAVEEYHQAIQRDPAYVAARINLASALDEKGDYEAARRELETVLNMTASNAERSKALNNLGVIAAKQSRLDEAQSLLEKAVAANPRFSDPHFNLARLWEMKNDAPAAFQEYKRYSELADNERDGWLRMAYSKLNKPWPMTESDSSESLPRLGHLRLGDTLPVLIKQLGSPTMTWKLRTPTEFDFSISLFESAGLIVSGAEGIIDFIQTTPRYTGTDSTNHLANGMTLQDLAARMRRSTRVPLTGGRESYINFDSGLGINFRGNRVDAWYIFEPLD